MLWLAVRTVPSRGTAANCQWGFKPLLCPTLFNRLTYVPQSSISVYLDPLYIYHTFVVIQKALIVCPSIHPAEKGVHWGVLLEGMADVYAPLAILDRLYLLPTLKRQLKLDTVYVYLPKNALFRVGRLSQEFPFEDVHLAPKYSTDQAPWPGQ